MEHLKKEQMIFSALFAVEVIKAPMETPAVFVAGSYSGTFRNPIRQKVLESYRNSHAARRVSNKAGITQKTPVSSKTGVRLALS